MAERTFAVIIPEGKRTFDSLHLRKRVPDNLRVLDTCGTIEELTQSYMTITQQMGRRSTKYVCPIEIIDGSPVILGDIIYNAIEEALERRVA